MAAHDAPKMSNIFYDWYYHLESCPECQPATVGRLGGTRETIISGCCEVGKPLYKALCEEDDKNKLLLLECHSKESPIPLESE